jgi:hypothetical protein
VLKLSLNRMASAVIALGIFVSPAALADQIKTFSLTVDGCTGGCGAGPYGTITLDQINSTTVLVTETLAAGEHFVSTGAGDSLEFNLTGVTGTTTLTNISAHFHQDLGSPTASTLGSFGFGVDCDDVNPICHGGSGSLTSLSFDVTNPNGISLSNFSKNTTGPGYYFASDIFGNGNTGNVGSTGPGTLTGTPEPATLGLIGFGLVGIALIRRRSLASTRS